MDEQVMRELLDSLTLSTIPEYVPRIKNTLNIPFNYEKIDFIRNSLIEMGKTNPEPYDNYYYYDMCALTYYFTPDNYIIDNIDNVNELDERDKKILISFCNTHIRNIIYFNKMTQKIKRNWMANISAQVIYILSVLKERLTGEPVNITQI